MSRPLEPRSRFEPDGFVHQEQQLQENEKELGTPKQYRFLGHGANNLTEYFMAFMPHNNGININVLIYNPEDKAQLTIMQLERPGANEVWQSAREDHYSILASPQGFTRLNSLLEIYGLPSVLVQREAVPGDRQGLHLSLLEVDQAQELDIISPNQAGILRRKLTMKPNYTDEEIQIANDLRRELNLQTNRGREQFQ